MFRPVYDSAGSVPYQWYCPDIQDIELQNDPRQDPDGISSLFIINYCDYTALNLRYEDPNCEIDKSKTNTIASSWLVNSKIITQFFDPVSNSEDSQSLGPRNAVSKSGTLDLESDMTPQLAYTVSQTQNYLDDS